MAVIDPTIVFASHPSCQSVSRTKAAKARLMTSCLGSAPYWRGLNTVQLAFCVWGCFSDTVEYRESPLSISQRSGCIHIHTRAQQHASPWSTSWSVEPGVNLKTRSDNQDSCRGWKPVLDPHHKSLHRHLLPHSLQPAKQVIVSDQGLWYFICHEMDMDMGQPWDSFSKKDTATATGAAGCWAQIAIFPHP